MGLMKICGRQFACLNLIMIISIIIVKRLRCFYNGIRLVFRLINVTCRNYKSHHTFRVKWAKTRGERIVIFHFEILLLSFILIDFSLYYKFMVKFLKFPIKLWRIQLYTELVWDHSFQHQLSSAHSKRFPPLEDTYLTLKKKRKKTTCTHQSKRILNGNHLNN